MRRPLLLVALTLLAVPALAAPASPPAAPAKPPAQAAAHAVVLKDGTSIPCVEPPLVALGRVLYKTEDGARHALPMDRVDLEKTRPAQAPAPQPAGPRPVAAKPPAAKPADPSTRRSAPDFTAKTSDGKDVKLSDLRGRVVLLDFWATWCGPCVADMPNVKSAYKKHAGPQFEIVGISLDRSRVELDAFVKAQGMTWPQHFDAKGWENAVAQAYGVHSIPTTLLLDRQGRIAKVGLRGPMLDAAIAELIAEPAAKDAKPAKPGKDAPKAG